MGRQIYLCYAESTTCDLSGRLDCHQQSIIEVCLPYRDIFGRGFEEAWGVLDSPTQCTQVQDPSISSDSLSVQPKGSGRSELPLGWFLIIELILLYAAYRIACVAGLFRTDVIRRFYESVKKMACIGTNPGNFNPIVVPCRENVPPKSAVSQLPQEDNIEMRPAVDENTSFATPPDDVFQVDSTKVDWNNFTSLFKQRDLHDPFPTLEVASDVALSEAESLLRDNGLMAKRVLDDCRDNERRRDIALEFCSCYQRPESEWNDASLLLTADSETTYWVAGDIHANVGAVAKVCAVIEDRHRKGLTKRNNLLILLGDYVDRGNEHLETLAYIESLKLHSLFEGFEVVTLKGNHDIGLSINAEGKYVSMVSPAETAAYFQDCADHGNDVAVEAEAAMRLALISPRMCELTGIDPDKTSRTMMFVHGGVPHVDLQEKLYSVRNGVSQGEPFFKALSGDLVSEELRRNCAEDFTWVRFSKDLPMKLPNRGSRGCEIGTEDVSQYLFLHRVLTSRDITFIFRGHDHERLGFACYSPHPDLNPTKKKFVQRECNVLTLNAMEPDYSSSGMFRERDIVVAEWNLGDPVRLRRIITRHLEEAESTKSQPSVSDSTSLAQQHGTEPPQVKPEDLMN